LSKVKVLVVEDERIVAKDIQNTLKNLGYEVPAIASTGEEAINKTGELLPDIVLMDIVLKGNIDGIDAASRIKAKYKTPIIYLTAYEDEETLDRAKITEPLGYILKPFEERDLHTTLEMALYKHSMESKLFESEERYRTLVESSPDGIAIEAEKKIIFVNQAAAKLTGETDPRKLLGRSIVDYIPGERLESFKEKIKKANDNRSSIHFIEEQLNKKDGTTFYAEVAMLPFVHEGKIALQIILRDISERKKAEEELKKAYSDLQKTQQALIHSEKLSALGRFSAGIAHEIRNPLANISASAQFCLSKYEIDKNMKKHFDVILRNTESANRIIKELLDFTSPRETLLAPGNISEVLKRVCELVKTRCIKHKVELIRKFRDDLPQIPLNEKKLEEAFMNFLSNAIEAMPEGGMLTVNADIPKDDNTIVVSFSDTGTGISAEDMDKVFEPFFTTKDDGTGLGLSLAYHIINAHSGDVNFESLQGKGSTVTIRFPVTDGETIN
jgi:two-component system cell cycle sensor histidine kinase/response regulator CckA